MTVPSYTTDLSTIDLIEAGSSFFEFSGYALGDGAAVETDWYLQGSACASDEANNKTGVGHSIGVDYGSNVTFSTGDCFFAWMMCMAGNAMDTYANGGYRVLMGSSSSVFYGWYVGGRDFGRNPYGGWTNVVVDPTATAQDTGHGSPTTWRYFGVAFVLTSGIGKGRPNCADAYRYGRGELIIEHGETANYGIFSGIAAQNDASANYWGLFQSEGSGYLWKGLLSFGNSTNLCDFRDSNVNVTIDDTPRTYAAFNKIEINNASSRIDWTGVSFSAVNASQLSVGSLEVIDDADVNLDTCTFTDMSTFIFDSNSTILTTTFRRCGQVTQGAGVFTDCVFEESDAAVALVVDTIGSVTGCNFVSAGTGHAVNLGTISSSASITWNNTEEGYAAQGGTAANRTLLVSVASGQVLTINVSSGASTPTYYNTGSGSVTIVAGSVDVEITVQTSGGTVIASASVFLLASGTGPFPVSDVVTISNSGTTATVTHSSHAMKTGDRVYIQHASLGANNGTFTITVINTGSYSYTMASTPGSSPTGTIHSTYVLIYEYTTALGIADMSNVFSSDQDVSGWVRKSTSTPFYQQGAIAGTVDSGAGFSTTVQLVLDE